MQIFGSIGLGIGIYCVYKIGFDYIEKRKREQQIAQARLQRLKNERQRAQRREFATTAALDESAHLDPQMTARRARNSNSASDPTNNTENSTCVICLTNPRELVLLDCGHVCLCMDCFGE